MQAETIVRRIHYRHHQRWSDRTNAKVLFSSKTSAVQDRTNAKERAEAVQLQKAIDQSLLEEAPQAENLPQKSIHECLQEACPRFPASLCNNQNIEDEKDARNASFDLQKILSDQTGFRFQCLLDVASSAISGGDVYRCTLGDVFVDMPDSKNQVIDCSMEIPSTEEWVLGDKMFREHSIYQEDSQFQVYHMDECKRGSEQISVKNETSNCPERIGCFKTRLLKAEEESIIKNTDSATFLDQNKVEFAGKENEANIFESPEKLCTSTDVPVVRNKKRVTMAMPETCQRSHLEANNKFAEALQDIGGKENIPTSFPPHLTSSMQSRDWQASYPKEQVSARNGVELQSFERFESVRGLRKTDKSQAFSSVSPREKDAMSSPAVLHRRVIGLSRRFRPPPLHPYLSR